VKLVSFFAPQVREFFKACGTMVTVDMPLRDGRASGTAYITFDSDEGVDKALELNEATFGDSGRWVRVLKYTAQQATARKSFGGETKEKPEGCTSVFIGASTFSSFPFSGMAQSWYPCFSESCPRVLSCRSN
jgi:RNA recognition motif-containing protein